MNVLVAGGSGFVGSNMLEFLSQKKNINIKTTYYRKKPIVKSSKIKAIKANLENFETCKKLTKNIDVVYMFAGHVFSHASLKQVLVNNKENQNLNIALNMIKSSINNNVKTFVWLSSFTGYPDIKRKMSENHFFYKDPPLNYFIPGQQARFLEKTLYFYSKLKQSTEIIIIRPTEIFGKYDDFDPRTCHAFPAYITKLFNALRKGEEQVYSHGNISNIKNYIYCADLVKTIFKLTKKRKKSNYNSYNLSSNHNYSLKKLFSVLLNLKIFKGLKIIHHFDEKKNKTIKRLISNKKVKKELKYLDETDFETCVKKTIGWYQKNKYENRKKR